MIIQWITKKTNPLSELFFHLGLSKMSKKRIEKAIKLVNSKKTKKIQEAREILEFELQSAQKGDDPKLEIAAQYHLARALHELGEYDDALRSFRQVVVKLESTPALARISKENMARIFRNRGDWERGIAIWEEQAVYYFSTGYKIRSVWAKLEVGHIYKEIGKLDEARKIYEKCLKDSKNLGDDSGAFNAMLALSTIDFFIGDYGSVFKTIENAKKIAESLNDDYKRVQTMKMDAQIAERNGDFDKADELYQHCYTKLTKLGGQHGTQAIQSAMGELFSKSDFDEAFRIYQDTQAFRTTIESINFMISIIQRIGEVKLAMWYPRGAASVLAKGLEISERIWEPRCVASLLEAQARATLNWSLEEAETLVRRSLEISETLSNSSGIATAHRTLGLVLKLKGNYSSAKEHFEKAIEIRRNRGGQFELCRDLGSFGAFLQETGAYKEAEEIYEEGLSISRDLDAKYEIALLLKSLGLLYYEHGILERSMAFLEDAKGYYEEMGITNFKILIHLAKVYLDQQNYDQADWFFGLASALAYKREDPHSVAACTLVASSINASKDQLKSAEELANVALQQSESIANFQLTARVHIALAKVSLQKAQSSLKIDFKVEDPFSFSEFITKSSDHLDHALASAKQAGLYPLFTEILIVKGILNLLVSKYDNA